MARSKVRHQDATMFLVNRIIHRVEYPGSAPARFRCRAYLRVSRLGSVGAKTSIRQNRTGVGVPGHEPGLAAVPQYDLSYLAAFSDAGVSAR